MHQNLGQKQWLLRNLDQTYLLVLEGLFGKRAVTVADPEDVNTVGRDIGAYSSVWTLAGSWHLAWVITTKTWPHPTAYSPGMPQAKQQGRNTAPLLADRLPKDFLIPQPPCPLTQPCPPGRHQKQENYNPAVCGTESAHSYQNLLWDPWVTRGECTAGTQRTSLAEGHFSKAEKHN